MHNKKRPKIRDYLFKTLEELDKRHFVLYYYEAYSTNSCYIKMDFGVCNSLRIADHAGKAKYPYMFNLLTNLSQSYEQDGRHFYALKDYDKMIEDIVAFREKQLEKYQTLHFFVSEDNALINGFLLGNTLYNYNNQERKKAK